MQKDKMFIIFLCSPQCNAGKWEILAENAQDFCSEKNTSNYADRCMHGVMIRLKK